MKALLLLALVLVGCMEGPTGPQGSKGEKGSEGDPGVNGQDAPSPIILSGYLTSSARTLYSGSFYYWTISDSNIPATPKFVQVWVRPNINEGWAYLTSPSYPAGAYSLSMGQIIIAETSSTSPLTGFEYRVVISR